MILPLTIILLCAIPSAEAFEAVSSSPTRSRRLLYRRTDVAAAAGATTAVPSLSSSDEQNDAVTRANNRDELNGGGSDGPNKDDFDNAMSSTGHRDSYNSVGRKRFLLDGGSRLMGMASCCFASLAVGSKPARGSTLDPKTGIRLPDIGEIDASVPVDWTGEENPFGDGGDRSLFARLDDAPDSVFYRDPRFVEHVDGNAVNLITDYVSNVAMGEAGSGSDLAVLDLCSSWTSHVSDPAAKRATRIAGLGMNEKELRGNPVLTEWTVRDLNENPSLAGAYESESFDVALIQLSVDYLTKPLLVMREVGRVLKDGGTVHVIFSNRLFLTKAVGLWTGGDDVDRSYFVGAYLRFCDGGFENIRARDLSTREKKKNGRIVGDPVYVVSATKRKKR